MNRLARQIARNTALWVLPSGVASTLARIRKEIMWNQREARNVLAANGALMGRHAGERVFILACGPSIASQNLKLLKGETCISVSNFFVHEDIAAINPRYHCVPDVLTWHAHNTPEYVEKWFREMAIGLPTSTIFLSFGDRRWVKQRNLFADHDVRYILFEGNWDDAGARAFDITGPVPPCQTVAVMALQIALFMGFDEIYLLGCDHDWACHFGHSRHFYREEQNVLATRPGHDEWAGGGDLGDQFGACARMWEEYRLLRNTASPLGIRILNATAGGVLDVFPRVEFESLFSAEPGV